MSVKAWKDGESGMPSFPSDFEIVKKAVLQVTDIGNNNNKYYALELHKSGKKFRVFTHYGRTDDLEKNPNSGAKECRFADSLEEAAGIYDGIYKQKTSPRKGYKELSLASSKIGSQKARGTSSGDVDAKTLEKMTKAKDGKEEPVIKKLNLHSNIQGLIKYIFSEAKTALTTTVSATITANGIETPLGILTLGQIEKGEAILTEMYELFKTKKGSAAKFEELSGDFYTMIPHRIGRTREAIAAAVINNMAAFQQKQDTLQLMKDMLEVSKQGGGVLYNEQIDQQYQSLKCDLTALEKDDPTYKEMEKHVIKSQIKSRGIKVKNVFGVKRAVEWAEFTSGINNQRLLFHGSRIQNWVGLLSRGILLPKIVVSMGVNRTDAGWLGSGIYFGDAACTSAGYASSGRQGTSFMAIARVALGKMKEFRKITYGIKAPPDGFNSCHGVRGSEFYDDEYVIYDGKQQRMEHLVEFTH